MLRHTFLSSLLLLVFAGLSSWWVVTTNRPNNQTNRPVSSNAEAQEVTVLSYTPQGLLRYRITSPQATHFDDNTTKIVTPKFEAFSSKGNNWMASANLATVSHNIVHLTGKVKLNRPASHNNQAVEVKTSVLNFHIDQNIATSPAMVTVTQPGTANYIEGKGLRADLNKGIVQLLHKVRSHYELN